jgi:hypothetical protein
MKNLERIKKQRKEKDSRMGMEYHGIVPERLVKIIKTAIEKNISGFPLQTTATEKKHIHNEHGNPETEEAIGQIAVTDDHYNDISDIVSNPDYFAVGVIDEKGNDVIINAKKLKDRTAVLIQNILDSKRNKALLTKTMFNKKNDLDK